MTVWRHIPNVISSLRILLVVPIGWSLLSQRLQITLWLFVVAAVSDAVDGYLARRFAWQSELGGTLDPIADKLMLATSFVCLALLGSIPVWLAAAVVGRDLVIVCGALAYRSWVGPVAADPTGVSKVNTLLQMAFILVVICSTRFSLPAPWLTVLLGATVFVLAVVSGIDYVLVYGRRALDDTRRLDTSARRAPRVV